MLANRQRAQEVLAAAEVDALLATTPTNLRYLGDLAPNYTFRAVRPGTFWGVLPADRSRPLGLVLPARAQFALDPLFQQGMELRCYGGQDPLLPPPADDRPLAGEASGYSPRFTTAADALADLLAALGLNGGRLALDDLTAGVVLAAGERLVFTLPTGSDLFRRVRAVKSAAEVARLRAATVANATALQAALAVAEPRQRWAAVEETWRRELASAGGEVLLWLGERPPSTGGGPLLQRHELLPLVAAGALAGYWSELGRLAVVGDRLPRAEKIATALATALRAAVATLVPGRSCAEVEAHLAAALREQGLSSQEGCAVRGIGLELAELPATGQAEEDLLEVGNVLVVSVAAHEVGGVTLTLSEMVLVGPAGPERLSDLPDTLLVTRG
jgi:Xaa-Pro dipeptidase